SELPEYRQFDYSPRLFASFVDIVDRIRSAHLELIAFVPPVNQFELEMMRQTGRWPDFQRWKRELAQHISYTDFSGYNGTARAARLFSAPWPVAPPAGPTIMPKLRGIPTPDCADAAVVSDSGLAVTSQNVEQVLALQEQRKDEATASPNLYSTTVAAA